jgi:AcrR family transcriptional regulator
MKPARIEKRRNEILYAAMDVFARKGYHATKISDIAGSLEIGNGTCYRYFKNKLHIFLSVLEKIVTDIGAVVASEPPDLTNSIEEYRQQLTRIGDKLFGVLHEHRRGRIIFYEIFGIDSKLTKSIGLAMDAFNKYTELYLVNGMKKGFLRADLDSATLAKAINEMLFGAMKDLLASPDPKQDLPRWMDAIVMLMLEGMGAASPAAYPAQQTLQIRKG